MLTANLKETINQKWNNCWPASELRPFGVIDLISFLFFIKRAQESKLFEHAFQNPALDNSFYFRPIINFSWSQLQNNDAKEIHQLFTRKNGLLQLANEYAKTGGPLSDYFKTPLLIEPTPKLLSISIDIINIIESVEQQEKEDIFSFLLSKCNEDSFLPDTILNSIIGFAKPVRGDVIFDPAVGSGNLLLRAMQVVQSMRKSDKVVAASGCDPNGIYLRIAAMNMIIHGADDHVIHAYSSKKISNKSPSLILSALRASDTVESSGETSQTGINIMHDIIESLAPRGRAVVFVQKEYLQSDLPAHIMTRKKLTDQNFLEAVVAIDSNYHAAFTGGAILLFSKNKNKSANVGFYKLENSKNQTDKEQDNLQHEGMMQTLEQWDSYEHSYSLSPANSFSIDINFLRTNHYNLNFNHYKIVNQFPATTPTSPKPVADLKEIVVTQKDNPGQFFKSSLPLPAKKRKRKMAPLVLIVIILLCASIGFYWFISKNNKINLSGKFFQSHVNVSSGNNVSKSNPEILSENSSDHQKKEEEATRPVKSNNISR